MSNNHQIKTYDAGREETERQASVSVANEVSG
jgi:hypothetical protein